MAARYRKRYGDDDGQTRDHRLGRRQDHDIEADYDPRTAGLPRRSRLPRIPTHGGISELFGRGRVAMALLMGGLAFVAYTVSDNVPVAQQQAPTLELGPQHDAELGRRSVRQMETQYGGLSSDPNLQNAVQQIGTRLVQQSSAGEAPFQFTFRVLADERTTNAFAIPGGHIYVTSALVRKLSSNAEIAAILAHEMAHVVQRHGIGRLANATLADGQTGAVVIASFLDEAQPANVTGPQVAQLVGETVNLRYVQDEELRSDLQAVQFLAQAGFDPNGLIRALRLLQTTATGQPTAFAKTHPNPIRRLTHIQDEIKRVFPQGVPQDYIP